MEEQLIAAVYKQKAIWDPADEMRKNSQILKSLWADVAKEVGVDVNVAKMKWKNLRAYFVKQHRDLDTPKPGSSGCTKTTSTWPFYNQLLFLQDVLMPSDSPRDFSLAALASTTKECPDQTQTVEMSDDFDPDTFMDSSESKLSTGKYTGTDTIPDSDMTETKIPSTNQPGPSRNKPATNKDEGNYSQAGKKSGYHIRREDINTGRMNAGSEGLTENRRSEIIDIERRKLELLEREMKAEENPDLLFFKSLLPYMQVFTPTQKLRIRSKIQNLILAEHEVLQHGSGTNRDFTGNASGMMSEYHQSQYYRSPSASDDSNSALYQ